MSEVVSDLRELANRQGPKDADLVDSAADLINDLLVAVDSLKREKAQLQDKIAELERKVYGLQTTAQ